MTFPSATLPPSAPSVWLLKTDGDKAKLAALISTYLNNGGKHVQLNVVTTEAMVAKLMWALALTKDPKELNELFYTPVAKDILCRER